MLWESSATIASTFGVSAGVFLIFFLGEVPRVRNDVLRQFPFLDQYYDRRIAPEDNVCFEISGFSKVAESGLMLTLV